MNLKDIILSSLNIIYKRKLALIVLLLSIHFIDCKSNKENEMVSENAEVVGNQVALSEDQLKNTDIQLDVLQKMNVGNNIILNGKVINAPQNLISIHAPLGGYVKKFKWMVGMPVRKGDIIATLENNDYIQMQQDYLLAKAALSLADEEFARQKELNKTKASSDKVLSQSALALESKKIEFKALEEQLKLIHINTTNLSASNITSSINLYAPVSGFISLSNANVGKYVQATETLAEIVDNSEIFVALKVYEKDYPFVGVGNIVSFYSNQAPEKKKAGKIIYAGRNISNEGYTEITCSVTSGSEWMPGMYVNGEVTSVKHEKYVVPEEAIVNFEGEKYIFVSDDAGGYEMSELKEGMMENSFVEVVNYTSFIDKKVVTKGAYTLLMKLKNKAE